MTRKPPKAAASRRRSRLRFNEDCPTCQEQRTGSAKLQKARERVVRVGKRLEPYIYTLDNGSYRCRFCGCSHHMDDHRYHERERHHVHHKGCIGLKVLVALAALKKAEGGKS